MNPRLLLLFLIIFILEATLAKKKKRVSSRREQLNTFVKEDEGDLVEPYLGGYNSQKSTFLVVEFFDFNHVKQEINPRWRAFREMVEDMQTMLLTGGVKANIFKQTETQIACVLNDAT